MALKVLLLSLFTSILWPSYIALKIGDLPGITLDRIASVVMVTFWLAHVATQPICLKTLTDYRPLLRFILLYTLWLVLSSLAGSANKISSVFAITDWFITGPFLMIYIFTFIKDENQALKTIKAAFIALLNCNLIGTIECIAKNTLFADFLITETQYTEKASAIKIRNDSYRIKSVFSNPLVYAQFLLISIVLSALVGKYATSFIYRSLSNINFIASYVLLFFTGSRAGLALALTYPAINIYIKLLKNRTQTAVAILAGIHFILVPAIIFASGYYVFENIDRAKNLNYLFASGEVDQETISTLARVLQMQIGFSSILEKPVFGYGMGQALTAIGPLNSIDNYYLTMLLSSGFIGLVILLMIVAYITKTAMPLLRRNKDSQTGFYFAGLALILIYYLILSINKADLMFYFFTALIFLRKQHIRRYMTNGKT